eukprot:857843_1
MASFIFYIAWITSSQVIVSKLSNTDAIFHAPCVPSKLSHIGPIHRFRTLDSNTNNTTSSLIPPKPDECALIHVPHNATPHTKSDIIALHDPIRSRFFEMITNAHNNIRVATDDILVLRMNHDTDCIGIDVVKLKKSLSLIQSVSMEERETPPQRPNAQTQCTVKVTMHSKEHDTHQSDQIGNVCDGSAISLSLFHLCRLLSWIIFIIYLNKQIKGFVVITICMAFTLTSCSALTISLGC